MAGRLEDEEYWHASDAKAFSFEDDEVSGLYIFCNHERPKKIRKLIIYFFAYCSLEVSCVGFQKVELQGCRKESEKEWEVTAPTSIQTRCLVSALKLQGLLKEKWKIN